MVIKALFVEAPLWRVRHSPGKAVAGIRAGVLRDLGGGRWPHGGSARISTAIASPVCGQFDQAGEYRPQVRRAPSRAPAKP
jgi:hypothetical protein